MHGVGTVALCVDLSETDAANGTPSERLVTRADTSTDADGDEGSAAASARTYALGAETA